MSEPTADQPPAWIADEDHCRKVLAEARTSDFAAFGQACRASPEANDGPWHLLVEASGKVHCGTPWDSGPLRVFTEPGEGEASKAAVEEAHNQVAGAFSGAAEIQSAAARVRCWNDPGEVDEWLGARAAAPHNLKYALAAEIETLSVEAAAGDMLPDTPVSRAAPEPQPPFTGSYEQLALLRSHVINLTEGKLSGEGMMTSDPDQLRHIADRIARFPGEGPAKVLLFAHGGLVKEKDGLALAWAYREWWMSNGIYPVYFVWETGLLETLFRLLSFERRPAGRGLDDVMSELGDKIIEAAARPLAKPIWSAIKRSAKIAGEAGGGARQFIELLAEKTQGQVALYGVGHSAGSILLARLLGALADSELRLEQLHLLAPAITIGDFKRLAEEQLAKWQTGLTVFGLNADREKADSCAEIYHKSVLYLVSNALETGRREPLVGLQEHFDRWSPRPGCESFFGPLDTPTDLRDATCAKRHTAFDNDPETMESVALRILGADGTAPPKVRFPRQAPRTAPPASFPPNFVGIDPGTLRNAPFRSAASLAPGGEAADPAALAAVPLAGAGTRRALCFGNNAFSGAPRLSGCINDAQAWARTLSVHGFSTETFPDCPADQMREVIRRNSESCSPGDVLVIHISSHGTQVEDRDGDEAGDTVASDKLDEATLGVDYDEGGLIIDDEWPGLIAVKPGVRVIRFHDFCNSGRTSRMALYGNRRVRGVRTGDEIARRAAAREPARGFDPIGESVPYLTFCACRPDQLAEEDGAMGIFSGIATEILSGAGAAMTARQFEAAIAARMDRFVQIPSLEGPAALRDLPLFGSQ